MSGREFDTDGTDSFHRQHPWEQTTHRKYVDPDRRSKENWPPVPAVPAGPAEAERWSTLPDHAPEAPAWRRVFGAR